MNDSFISIFHEKQIHCVEPRNAVIEVSLKSTLLCREESEVNRHLLCLLLY